MNKYDPLETFLDRQDEPRVSMSFAEIERVIEDNLPPSARRHRAWWSNNPSNSVITYAWLAAGYRASQVNMEGEHLVFVLDDTPEISSRPRRRHPLFGSMAGVGTLSKGVDLTKPADPDWGSTTTDPRLFNE